MNSFPIGWANKGGKFTAGGADTEPLDHFGGQILTTTDVDGAVEPAAFNPAPCRAGDDTELVAEAPEADQTGPVVLARGGVVVDRLVFIEHVLRRF